MKKFLVSILALITMVSIFALTTSTTYAASTYTHPSSTSQVARPAASGGGCDGAWRSSSSNDLRARACISYQYSQGYIIDGHVAFNPTSTVASCQASIVMYDTNNTNWGGYSWNCTAAANARAQNQYYSATFPVDASSVYGELFVSMSYTNHTVSWTASDSPVQNWL